MTRTSRFAIHLGAALTLAIAPFAAADSHEKVPGVPTCEAALKRSLGNTQPPRSVTLRQKDRKLRTGFSGAKYTEKGPMQVSLIRATSTDLLFYYEGCDICAALVACDLPSGSVHEVKTAHQLACADVPPPSAGAKVYFSACP